MTERIFEVEISNKTSKGYETATALEMPATWAEFHDALEKARIKDARDCHNELTKIEYPGIQRGMIGDNVNLYLLIQEHSLHPNNPYLFPSPTTGTMYSPETVARIHKRILRDAGLEDCRFHDLRHTFATVALQNGVDIKTLSGMLGHYSSGFTLDTYTHVTRKMQEEAAEKMGQFMEMKL